MKPSKDMKRMASAVCAAESTFWETIADAYPEATSGDVSPETSFDFAEAMREVVTSWLEYNVDECRKVVHILLHRIEYSYHDRGMEITSSDEEHIAYCISQGINEGALCTIPDGQDEEVLGYWEINNCPAQ